MACFTLRIHENLRHKSAAQAHKQVGVSTDKVGGQRPRQLDRKRVLVLLVDR
jgi:hypothetical protein